ncbi:hypothetical protein FRC04_004856 [Tulasnella sp. 424]|nr:hypothetical protein FRC04_004856 [Tulasnella sp. 424]KAG8963610.1 hypothetical protein FRC05_004582 [Tulasnella sp. 425]
MPSHRKTGNDSTKKLEQQNQQLQQNLDRTLAELHEARNETDRLRKHRRKLLKQRGETDQSNSHHGRASIPRPPGQNGKKGWKLREQMGLRDNNDDRLQYNQIRRGVRVCMDAAGIETSKKITEQEVGRLFQCYTLAKEQMPFLRRFRNDWATREIIKDVLIHRRKYQVRLAGQASSTTAGADQSGEESSEEPNEGQGHGKDEDDDDDDEGIDSNDDDEDGPRDEDEGEDPNEGEEQESGTELDDDSAIEE